MTSARPTTRALPAIAVEMPPPGTKAGATGWTRNPNDKRRGAASDRVNDERYQGGGGGREAHAHTVCAEVPRSRRRRKVCWGTGERLRRACSGRRRTWLRQRPPKCQLARGQGPRAGRWLRSRHRVAGLSAAGATKPPAARGPDRPCARPGRRC